MIEVIMPASWDQGVGPETHVQAGRGCSEGEAPTTRGQRYDRDARYAAIPARRSSAL